ncbi:MAG: aminoacyl-tRNA hydrolase [Ruminococcaceae bacterium]|nr:aminoacyl-tRNA hydrolase [Oscillospiraceae bacterium]
MANIFDLFEQIKARSAESSAAGKATWIVAGLGNPGAQYEKTRHNIGFRTIDELARRTNTRVDRLRFKALTAECTIGDTRVLLLKPQTFMNASGEAIREAMDWYKLDTAHLLVIYDDISLVPGRLRIRQTGSAGGHNGIKSIIQHSPDSNFPRIKVGVGSPPHPDYDLADWVLGTFSEEDNRAVEDAIKRAADAVDVILHESPVKAAERFNSSLPPTP